MEFPVELGHVWSAFINLSRTRSAGFAGANPLSYTEIKNYLELTDTQLKPWEIDTVMRLDEAYMRVQNG